MKRQTRISIKRLAALYRWKKEKTQVAFEWLLIWDNAYHKGVLK